MIIILVLLIWLLSMILYALLTSGNTGNHRCNVKKQVIKFRRIKNQVGESVKKYSRK